MEDGKYTQIYNVGKTMPYFFLSSFFDFWLVPYKLLNQRNHLKNEKPVIKQFVWYSQKLNGREEEQKLFKEKNHAIHNSSFQT